MASRGLIKEFDFFERIEIKMIWFILKDFAIDLEIKRDFYSDLVILSAPSTNPDKFAILDTIQKLYNQKYKTSVEKLIEQYKKEFSDGKGKVMKIRTKNNNKKAVSDIVKSIGKM